jgi:hypothetical protein
MNLDNKNKSLVDKIHEVCKCARSSARTYASTIRRIGDQFGGGYKKDLKFLHKPDILEKIKKLDASLAVKRNLSNGVIIGLKLEPHTKLNDKYHAYLLELNKQVDTQAKSGKLTEKQLAKMISWDKIVKLRKLLAKKLRLSQAMKQKNVLARDIKLINSFVLLACYTLTPPVRLDWSTVTYHNQKGFHNIKVRTGNYLILRKQSVTVNWNSYKTQKHHGSVTTELPKPLARILRRHCRWMKKHFPNNDRLFLNTRFEPLTRQNLSKTLENLFYSYFKKRISVSAIRRIYLSSKYKHSIVAEARKDANSMLHTVSEAQNSYVKQI